MAKKFAELEAKMSPESRARSEALYQKMRIALLPQRDKDSEADDHEVCDLQDGQSASPNGFRDS